MSNFDVFVNGIQPDYTTKIQQVIEEFSKTLQVEPQNAEKIITTPNTRIKQSTSKEEYSTPKSQDRYFNNPYSKILGSFILLIID